MIRIESYPQVQYHKKDLGIEPYFALRGAIIKQALVDWLDAKTMVSEHPHNRDYARALDSVEKEMKTLWFDLLLGSYSIVYLKEYAIKVGLKQLKHM